MKIANSLISRPERIKLFENGGRIREQDIRVGMITVNKRGDVRQVVAVADQGTPLPEGYRYSGVRPWKDQVLLSPGSGAPTTFTNMTMYRRDVTDEVYERLKR